MITLLETQRAFAAAILNSGGGTDALESQILGDAISAAERLEIYRHTAVSTLVRALTLIYPAVRGLVGEDFFEAAARQYLREHLPVSACLDEHGTGFDDFLARFEPADTVAYLSDVARLERLIGDSLRAPEAPALLVETLAQFPPQDAELLCFTPHPALRLLTSRYPVDLIWRAVLDEDDDSLRGIDLAEGPVHLLVERRHESIHLERLEPAAWSFARDLFSGQPLGTALGDARAPAWLGGHLAAQRLTGVHLNPNRGPAQASADAVNP